MILSGWSPGLTGVAKSACRWRWRRKQPGRKITSSRKQGSAFAVIFRPAVSSTLLNLAAPKSRSSDPGNLFGAGSQAHQFRQPRFRVIAMKDGRTDHQDVCPRADEFFKILEVNSAFHLKSEVQASVLTTRRWMSRLKSVARRRLAITGWPTVISGTKWPSITST